eukprot:4335791-Alexandrium_andersonii.AAC.1
MPRWACPSTGDPAVPPPASLRGLPGAGWSDGTPARCARAATSQFAARPHTTCGPCGLGGRRAAPGELL